MQRCLLLFHNSIKSAETREKYQWYLDRVLKFYHLKDYDSVISMDSKQLQMMIEDYVMDLKKKVNPNSVPSYVNPIQAFCDANDVDLRWKKIRKLFPAKIKASGKRAWMTGEVQKMLNCTNDLRTTTLIHVLASSGMRKGGVEDLKIKHLTPLSGNCTSILVYEDSTEEYVTFLTSEATQALNDYLDKRKQDGELVDQNSPVFRSKYVLGSQSVKHMTKESMGEVINRILHKAGLRTNKKGSRYETQMDHGFRKRFNTILKTTDGIKLSLAEKMMGHSVTIPLDDAYLHASIDMLFKEFKKAIPELTIDDSERKQVLLDAALEEKSENELLRAKLDKIQEDLDKVKQWREISISYQKK